MRKPMRWALIGGVVGGLVGTAVHIWKTRGEPVEETPFEPEVAYTFEEALAKAKAKVGDKMNGKDEGVKLVPNEVKPDLNSYKPSKEDRVAYDKILSSSGYSDGEDERPEPPEPEAEEAQPPQPEPWTDDEDGKFYRISEDKFKFENPFHVKLVGSFFPDEAVIGGWDEELEPVDNEELVRRMATLCQDPEHEDAYYFTCDEEETDYEIDVSEYKWAEAYEDYRKDA